MNLPAQAISAQQDSAGRGLIYDNILQTIGKTPMVRLSRFRQQQTLHAEVLAKIEFFNPAGSIKDRPALAMIEKLIAQGKLNENSEIIEATSGNNGVACAWICALKNIPLTIVMPEHMSIERRKLIKHYGAKVILTPRELGTKGAIDKAKALVAANSNAVMLDQFGNQANVEMHQQTTAEEIWFDTNGQIDVLVAGIGTGGTLTGIASVLKQRNPDLKVVAVEPASCPVLSQGRSGVHKIQGLSSGHVPDILNTALIDEVICIEDDEAIAMARAIAQTEGLPVGISSGAALAACANLGRRIDLKGANIVTILADNAERYFSTDLFED